MKSNFKKSVNIVLVLAFTFFIGTIAQAQPGQGGQGGQGGQQRGQQGPPAMPTAKQITKMVDDVAKELSLTAEQKTKVSALYVAHFKDAQELLDNNKNAGESQRTAMDKLKLSFEKQVKAVLTEEQQKKFVAYQKKNEPKQGGPQRQ